MEDQKKSFFERMGEILNAPLPGTEAKPEAERKSKLPNELEGGGDGNLLARIRDILNTPLPGSEMLNQEIILETTEIKPTILDVSEEDFVENWWEEDWKVFKEHQDQDRKGLNMKQRQDQEGFAQYQEQEHLQFEMYQAQEFEIFQNQQQAKINWLQDQQLAAAAGQEVVQYGIVPPPAPVAPLPPGMPSPPWVKTSDDFSNMA